MLGVREITAWFLTENASITGGARQATTTNMVRYDRMVISGQMARFLATTGGDLWRWPIFPAQARSLELRLATMGERPWFTLSCRVGEATRPPFPCLIASRRFRRPAARGEGRVGPKPLSGPGWLPSALTGSLWGGWCGRLPFPGGIVPWHGCPAVVVREEFARHWLPMVKGIGQNLDVGWLRHGLRLFNVCGIRKKNRCQKATTEKQWLPYCFHCSYPYFFSIMVVHSDIISLLINKKTIINITARLMLVLVAYPHDFLRGQIGMIPTRTRTRPAIKSVVFDIFYSLSVRCLFA